MRVPFSPYPHQYLFVFFLIMAIWTGGVIWWFWLAFPWWLVIMSIISCASWPSVCLWKNMYSYPLSIMSSLVTQLVRNPSAMQETWVQSLGWEDPLEKGKGYPFQYVGLENSMDCIVHGVAKTWTRLNNLHFHKIFFHLCPFQFLSPVSYTF